MSGPAALAALAWAAWGAGRLLAPLRGWEDWLGAWAGTGPGELAAGVRGAALADHAVVAAVAAAVGAACWRAGGAVVALLAGARPRGAVLHATAVLVGFALLGAAYLGLGLAGLYTPGVLAATAAAGLAAPGSRRPRSWSAAIPPWWVPAALPAVLLVVAYTRVPTRDVDVLAYHLAVPELFLRLHRAVFAGVAFGFQVPLAVELVYGLGLATGRDGVSSFLNFVPLAAAVGVIAGVAARDGRAGAGWAAALGVLSVAAVSEQALLGKNSLAAAAYPLAGAALALAPHGPRGRGALAAVLFGCGAAAKWSGLPFLGLGLGLLAARAGTVRAAAALAAVAAVPLAPWLAKSWLTMGDPLFPFLARWLPGALWDAPSAASMAVFRGAGPAAGRLGQAVPSALDSLWAAAPAAALLLPWWGFTAAGRGATGFLAAGWCALWWLMPGDAPRLAIPVWGLLAAETAAAGWRAAARGSAAARAAAGVALAAAVWLPAGNSLRLAGPPVAAARYLTGAVSRDAWQDQALTTIWRLRADLRRAGVAGGVAWFGDDRTFGVPGRPRPGTFYHRSEGWAAARECADADRIRVRFRQADLRFVVYNFVGEKYPHPAAAPFTWDEGALRRWEAFVGRGLDLLASPDRIDPYNGGFAVYAVRPRLRAAAPAHMPYLPGLDSLLFTVTRERDAGRWLAAAQALAARLPRVDTLRSLEGIALNILGRWPAAWAAWEPGIRRGLVDESNLLRGGLAAANTGRLDEAVRLLTRARMVSPQVAPEADRVLALIAARRAGPRGPALFPTAR